MSAEQLKGHLDALLLAIVEDAPAHGYAIISELRRRSADAFNLPEGTVYPALHRLERLGLLKSTPTSFKGRPRRVYELTGQGMAALDAGRDEWQRFARAVDSILSAAR
jgi:PadR family transcriptional regulator PadR